MDNHKDRQKCRNCHQTDDNARALDRKNADGRIKK